MFIYTKELSPEVANLPLNAITVEMLPAELAEQAACADLVILVGKDSSRHLKHWGKTQHATRQYTVSVPAEPPVIPQGWDFRCFSVVGNRSDREAKKLEHAVAEWIGAGINSNELVCKVIIDGCVGYSCWNDSEDVWMSWLWWNSGQEITDEDLRELRN